MSKESQVERFGLKAQFWPNVIEESEQLEFDFKVVDELPKEWLKKARRLFFWAFIDKKRFNKFQIVGFDEMGGGQVTVCPLKIYVTLNCMGATDQILVIDGVQSYLLLSGKSASNLYFILNMLYQEKFLMYDSRSVHDFILASISEIPPFEPEKVKEMLSKKNKEMEKERKRRNLAGF